MYGIGMDDEAGRRGRASGPMGTLSIYYEILSR